ncbi:PAS domain S-box protein [Chloroflexota bacterium]
MKDKAKTKEQLINELAQMRQQVVGLRTQEAEYKQAEEKLRESEEKFRTFVETASDLMNFTDKDGKYTYVNNAMVRTLGYSEEELLGMNITQLLTKESLNVDFGSNWNEFLVNGEISLETIFLAKDGKEAYCEIKAVAVYDSNGNHIGSRAVHRDITERKKAEAALKRSEQNFRNSLDDSPFGIRIVDADGKLLYANQAILDIYGYSSVEEMKAIPTKQRYTPESYTKHQERAEKRKRGKPIPSDYELDIVRKDGEVRNVHLFRKEVVWDGETRFQSLYLDITERKQEEEALKESEEKWRSLGENAPNVIMLVDHDRKIQSINHVVAGVAIEDVLGKSIYGYIQPEDREDVRKVIDRVFRTGKPDTYESMVVVSGREDAWYETRVGPLKHDGQITGVIQIASDVTNRKQAEKRIRIFSQSIAGAIDGITITDMEGVITYANSAMEETHGYEKEGLLGKLVTTLIASQETADEMMSTVIKTGSWKGEAEGLKKTKETFPLLLSLSTVNDEKGHQIALMGAARDITERKQMEEQLIVADRLASIGGLASGIAHEINNPLTAIVGFSDLLDSREDLPDDIKGDIRIINTEAKRTSNIVKNLLTFARKQPKEKQLTNVNKVIEAVLELRAYEQKVNNIEVNIKLAPDLPEIMANNSDLQQVFLNIILNAEYAMLETQRDSTYTITTKSDGDTIKITFVDNGQGISKKNLGHVFDPFFTTKEVGKGTGLGLSICHGIIIEHGGRIGVEGKLGKGATFIVELPLPATNDGETAK